MGKSRIVAAAVLSLLAALSGCKAMVPGSTSAVPIDVEVGEDAFTGEVCVPTEDPGPVPVKLEVDKEDARGRYTDKIEFVIPKAIIAQSARPNLLVKKRLRVLVRPDGTQEFSYDTEPVLPEVLGPLAKLLSPLLLL